MTDSATVARPQVSVVIPTYKRPRLVRRAAASALAQTLHPSRYEVIVVDSSPDDDSVKPLMELREAMGPERLRVYRKAPEGPGPSRNLGASHARGEIIAFLDDDCEAAPGWLEAGLAAFGERVGIVQGRTLPDPNGRPGVLTRYVRIEEESFYYETANIFYRRDCFLEAGPFPTDATPDSNWPTGGEDTLVAWRAKRGGWESRFATDALVYHEIVPVGPWFWLFNKRLLRLPMLTREIPELRRFFVGRYFYDWPQAMLCLALLGLVLAPVTPWTLLSTAPYMALRMTEPTRTLHGFRRPLRALAYLPRDLLAFGLLAAGSWRYRSLLL